MKQNQFKPLHSWRNTIGEIPVYATTFFFNNILGLLYQYIDGRFSVVWEKEEYNSTQEDIEDCLGSELYSAVVTFVEEESEWSEEEVNHTKVIKFKYNGIQGLFDKSKDVYELTYNGKVYKFYPAVELSEHQDTSFFTEDDIDLLIFLRDELNIEAFPFSKSNGEITYLFLNKNWLFDVAIRLLYVLKSSKMFNIVGSTLYIDGVEFDYKSRCSFGICDYGEYSYGIIEVDIHRCPQMFLSSTTNSGCKFGYFKSYLTMLPLSKDNGRVYFDNSHSINEEFLSISSNSLSRIPINEVIQYKVFNSYYSNSREVEFIIKQVV